MCRMHQVIHHLRAVAPIILAFVFFTAPAVPKRELRSHRAHTAEHRMLPQLAVPFDATYLGTASWYGVPFHGRLTANGERYDMFHLSAAHKTLPFGSLVLVTNLKNQKKVTVRINDRGPYVQGRSIDLSYEAAKALAMLDRGTAPVKLEVILPAVHKSGRHQLANTPIKNKSTRRN